MLGFAYTETLHGGFYFLDDPVDERPADLVLEVAATDVVAFAQSRTARLGGKVTLGGFADATLDGTLVLDADARRVSYELRFRANDDSTYRLRGYKELSWLNLVDSFTLLRASVYDGSAREVARAVVRFDARGNWASLVRSWRVTA
jgi:hypothetical protein